MSTLIRPEITKSSPYWISKHRFYELKHFCLQYPEWTSTLAGLNSLPAREPFRDILYRSSNRRDPTAEVAMVREFYTTRIDMVRRAAVETDECLAEYLLKGVTQGLGYQNLKMVHGLPCCKDVYYDAYRQFFFLLSSLRN